MDGAPIESLRIVSYNMHKGLAAGNLRPVLDRMRGALRRLDADVVLVQEVVGDHEEFRSRFRDWPEIAQFEYLADRVWPHFAYGRNAVYDGGDHGNAILSKYPILDWENIDISMNPLEHRGILHATIDVPGLGRDLHVCCTHLNLLHRQRKRQIHRLAARVHGSVPDDCPLVIGGDFNDWRTWATGALEREIGVEEAFVAVNGRHARTYPGWRPVLALDRIYVRGLAVARARVLDGHPWRGLSDHLGLEADLLPLPASGPARA